MSDVIKNEEIKESYDELPYESYSYPLSHPEQLCIVASLMGYDYPDFTKARVLELGCAGGGNILPLAIDYPDAKFVGIDLSPVQIEEANQHTKALDLKNIEFSTMDIMDIDKSFGEFDFIICHGVFSWVPGFVRDKLLEIFTQNLSEKGLVSVSWNVMPGWATQRSIREMILMHTKTYDCPKEKVEQAKLFIDFLDNNMLDNANLKRAISAINKKFKEETNDSYILHEYMEHNNEQYYFSKFNDMLENNKLKYVGDSILASMNIENFTKDAITLLRNLDPTTKEQYMDMIINRQFRWSVVTKKTNKQSKVDINIIKNMYFYTTLKCDPNKDGIDLRKEHLFTEPGSSFNIKSNDPITNSLLNEISKRQNYTYSFNEMLEILKRDLPEYSEEILNKSLLSGLVKYIMNGAIRPKLRRYSPESEKKDKPESYRLSRYQASLPNVASVTTLIHTTAKINENEIAVIKYLDGKHSYDAIIKKLMKQNITVHNKGTKDISKGEIKKSLRVMVETAILGLTAKSIIKK